MAESDDDLQKDLDTLLESGNAALFAFCDGMRPTKIHPVFAFGVMIKMAGAHLKENAEGLKMEDEDIAHMLQAAARFYEERCEIIKPH